MSVCQLPVRKKLLVLFGTITARITALKQIFPIQCFHNKRHLVIYDDVSGHELLCISPFDMPYHPLKFIPIFMGHSVQIPESIFVKDTFLCEFLQTLVENSSVLQPKFQVGWGEMKQQVQEVGALTNGLVLALRPSGSAPHCLINRTLGQYNNFLIKK